jgi:hypothetical secreted protein
MKKLSKIFTSVLMVLVMLFSFSFSAFAIENKSDTNDQLMVTSDDNYSLASENYEMVTSGYLELNSDGSVRITDKYVDYVQKKMEERGVSVSVLADSDTITIVENTPAMFMRSSNSGVTKVKWLSFDRFEIYLDNNLSNKVVAGTGIGVALSTWIPEPVVSKIVSTALGVSAGLIAFNNQGRGVIVSGIYTLVPQPLATFYWIKPQ